MRVLYLHIGHMKTGSTWLQTSFKESRVALNAAGIHYPSWGHDATKSNLDQRTTAGNAAGLFNHFETFLQRLNTAPDRKSLFLSSETMFDAMCQNDDLAGAMRQILATGFDKICVLLFVRDPLGLGASVWQQRVKGWQGETRDLDEYFRDGFDLPERVCSVVEQLQSVSGVEVTIHNYSQVKDTIKAIAEDWLGITSGVLSTPDKPVVNRSMTASEVALQLQFNRALGRASGKMFGFRLINRLADVPRDPPQISRAGAKAALAQHGPYIERINAMLPANQSLSVDLSETSDTARSSYVFTEAQLEQIAAGIAENLPAAGLNSAQNPDLRKMIRGGLKRMLPASFRKALTPVLARG